MQGRDPAHTHGDGAVAHQDACSTITTRAPTRLHETLMNLLSTSSEPDRLPLRDRLANGPSNNARGICARSSMNAVRPDGCVRIAVMGWVVVCACWVSAAPQAPPGIEPRRYREFDGGCRGARGRVLPACAKRDLRRTLDRPTDPVELDAGRVCADRRIGAAGRIRIRRRGLAAEGAGDSQRSPRQRPGTARAGRQGPHRLHRSQPALARAAHLPAPRPPPRVPVHEGCRRPGEGSGGARSSTSRRRMGPAGRS